MGQRAKDPCDLLVVGGGATGLGVALQASLEGRSVMLVEARDFACGTSSRSTKLLHGGVRYLAQGRLKLVKEALRERSIVLSLAPHLAQPIRFVVAQRGWWSLAKTAVGLTLYSALAGRFGLGPTQFMGASTMKRILPKVLGPMAGVSYWDGQFEDARLALALARTADDAGAWVRNHTRVTGIERVSQGWRVELLDELSAERASLRCRCLVNATGVWVDGLRHQALKSSQPQNAQATASALVRPSQGVHLVVARSTLPLTQAVLVPQTTDGRVLFALPWLGATLIGTTDTPRADAPLEPQATRDELAFLFEQCRLSLGVELKPSDVQSVWVGLRPLVNQDPDSNTAELSREHVILREAPGFVSVTGGKWTTYRAMAQEVLQALVGAGDLPPAPRSANSERHELHGAVRNPQPLDLQQNPGPHLFGSDAALATALPGRDRELGMGLTESMVRFSARFEWAITVEDMLARRWRMLFLDARKAKIAAPRVAEILHEETGIDPQLDAFTQLTERYILDSTGGST